MVTNSSENKHLPENLELFFDMVENARDGINITQNGVFKYVNRAFCDMLGYSREELCCTTASDLIAASDKERMMTQHFMRMQDNGQYGIDYTTLVHKSGAEVAIEFRRRGFMTEAVGGMIEWANQQPDVKAILASTDKTNVASYSVLQKIQFAKTGESDELFHWRLQL